MLSFEVLHVEIAQKLWNLEFLLIFSDFEHKRRRFWATTKDLSILWNLILKLFWKIVKGILRKSKFLGLHFVHAFMIIKRFQHTLTISLQILKRAPRISWRLCLIFVHASIKIEGFKNSNNPTFFGRDCREILMWSYKLNWILWLLVCWIDVGCKIKIVYVFIWILTNLVSLTSEGAWRSQRPLSRPASTYNNKILKNKIVKNIYNIFLKQALAPIRDLYQMVSKYQFLLPNLFSKSYPTHTLVVVPWKIQL